MFEKNYRDDFMLLRESNLIYCDNAATTQKPDEVTDRITEFYERENAPVHRGFYSLAESTTAKFEEVRDKVKNFINASDRSEIVFTSGTTQSINIVANSWARKNLKEGDEIVITELEHHSNILPWQRVANETGAVLRWIEVNENGELDYDSIQNVITTKTKLVAVTAASNVIGGFVNLEPILTEAYEVNARVLIDAAQFVPHKKCDVQKFDCDFLVFSAHKMLGPTGVGVLYVKKKLYSEMEPSVFGGGMVLEVKERDSIWLDPPYCFEAGTPNIAGVIGFGAALDYLTQNVDFDELKKHESALTSELVKVLSDSSRVHFLGDKQKLKHGNLVSFTIDEIHADDVATYLNKKNIAVRSGTHCAQSLHKKLKVSSSVRTSFYLYNNLSDVEVILDTIRELIE